ncbi:MAG: trigger factor [Spirochaetia bacterium]
MIANKDIERLDNSAVKLTVTVEQSALKQEYDDLLAKYAKSAQIKGFRKGKVPASVLERKFGEGIKQEAAANSIEKSLKELFDEIEEKPLPYVTPELQDEELDPDLDKDLTFTVTYDIFPEIKLGEYKGLDIEVPKVTVTKEDEQRELDEIRDRNAVVTDKLDETVAKDDIVTIDYAELDEKGEEKEETKREGFVFTVGTGYNLHKVDDDVIGMKKDEEKVLDKEYPEDFEYEDLAGKKIKLKVKVTAVKEKKLPDLDDDLAQDVSEKYESLDDLKKDIRERLEKAAENRLREMKVNKLLDKLVENSEIDLPRSMVEMELQNSWRSFLMRSRMPEDQAEQILGMQGKSKEALLEEWTPQAEQSLKSRLLVNKIIEKEGFEVSEEELDEEMKKQAEANDMSFEQVKEQYSQSNYMDYLKNDILDRKAYDFLIENADIKEGKKVKFLDLMNENR